MASLSPFFGFFGCTFRASTSAIRYSCFATFAPDGASLAFAGFAARFFAAMSPPLEGLRAREGRRHDHPVRGLRLEEPVRPDHRRQDVERDAVAAKVEPVPGTHDVFRGTPGLHAAELPRREHHVPGLPVLPEEHEGGPAHLLGLTYRLPPIAPDRPLFALLQGLPAPAFPPLHLDREGKGRRRGHDVPRRAEPRAHLLPSPASGQGRPHELARTVGIPPPLQELGDLDLCLRAFRTTLYRHGLRPARSREERP